MWKYTYFSRRVKRCVTWAMPALCVLIITIVLLQLGIKKSETIAKLCSDQTADKFLIIFAYERTGSSFLGEIFNRNPKFFYFYEPLKSLIRNKAFTYPRRLDSESQNHVTSEDVGSALTCDFMRLPRSLVLDEITRYRSIDLYSAYDFCLNVHKIDLNSDQKMLNFCLRFAMGSCRSKQTRVVKLVRETMDGVQYLMDKNQHCQHKIRILFLVRDPRPQLLSMARTNKIILNSQRAADMSRKLCPRILKDLRIARNFEKKHPGTLMFVRYEDLAEQPLAVTKRIYSFIDEPLHPNVTEWIDKNTAATNIKEESQYETKRRNSSATASFWRSWIGRRPARTIDVECSEVYRHLGYKEIHTLEHLRNSTFALKHPWNWKIMRPNDANENTGNSA